MYGRIPFGVRLFLGFRIIPEKLNLYAQIQCLLRLMPLIFTVFSVSLLKHFFHFLYLIFALKNPRTET